MALPDVLSDFPHDLTQLMHFCQEFHRSRILSFIVHRIRRHILVLLLFICCVLFPILLAILSFDYSFKVLSSVDFKEVGN